MKNHKINLEDKFKKFLDFWSPKVIAEMNDYQFKLAKVKGEFIWHSHEDTDEVFLVIKGELIIYLKEKMISLKEGELFVVPIGIEHKPYAPKECQIMLVERKGVINTGSKVNNLTAPNDVWV